MIERRVNFSGIILPEKIRALGHGYVPLWRVHAEVPAPRDNSAFIGFIIAVDTPGAGARRIARQGLERLRVVMYE